MANYTKTEIIRMLEVASKDMAVFYKQGFINYRGKTTDTKELYTEVISEWCCENYHLFDGIPMITRISSYKVDSHNGVPDNSLSNREEELIAMAIFRQRKVNGLGEILDYQTPLKNKREDRAGKIDLLSFDGNYLRILELKEPDSKETMLRCVLEGCTYLRTVDIEKLLIDFGLPTNVKVIASPLVFLNGYQYKEMKACNPWLKKLIHKFSAKPLYIQNVKDEFLVVEES